MFAVSDSFEWVNFYVKNRFFLSSKCISKEHFVNCREYNRMWVEHDFAKGNDGYIYTYVSVRSITRLNVSNKRGVDFKNKAPLLYLSNVDSYMISQSNGKSCLKTLRRCCHPCPRTSSFTFTG